MAQHLFKETNALVRSDMKASYTYKEEWSAAEKYTQIALQEILCSGSFSSPTVLFLCA